MKEINKGVEIPNEQDNITEETVILNDEEKETNENNKLKQIIIDNKIRQRQPRNQISSNVKSSECPECGITYSD